jgi:hypothetical protein
MAVSRTLRGRAGTPALQTARRRIFQKSTNQKLVFAIFREIGYSKIL